MVAWCAPCPGSALCPGQGRAPVALEGAFGLHRVGTPETHLRFEVCPETIRVGEPHDRCKGGPVTAGHCDERTVLQGVHDRCSPCHEGYQGLVCGACSPPLRAEECSACPDGPGCGDDLRPFDWSARPLACC